MRGLSALLIVCALSGANLAFAAQPPSQAVLDRLGLRTEWVSAVPLLNERDGIVTIQVADRRQIFVQTRAGMLFAFDATTGDRLWSFRYDVAAPTPFRVAWNDRYVFAFNVTRMYGIQRVTGILDFMQKMPLSPTAPPAADNSTVYVVMGGNRIAAYILPQHLAMPDPKLIAAANVVDPTGSNRIASLRNPADVVADRYPATSRNLNMPSEQFDRRVVRLTTEPAFNFGTSQRTASLAIVATLRPPYSSFDEGGRYLNTSPSLSVQHSLRQPYALQDPTAGSVQRTPSIAIIPPSLVSLHESTNLRPRGVELQLKWIFGSTAPLRYSPLVSKSRVWAFTSATPILAADRNNASIEVDARLSAPPSAGQSQALDVGYVPQTDGYLTAIDLEGGSPISARVLWKANVAGFMNAAPIPTADAIYQPSSRTGIMRIDRATGEIVWRTENTSDQFLAVNAEHVYARNDLGRVFVYPRNTISDPLTHTAYPLAAADLPDFTHGTENRETDRLYLASPSGLFVCLRDSAPRYAKAETVAPPKTTPPPKAVEPPAEIER